MSNTHQTVNPATEEVLETYSLMSREEAEGIVEQAHAAFLDWRRTGFSERADILRKTAQLIQGAPGRVRRTDDPRNGQDAG